MVSMKVHEVNVLDGTKPIGTIIWALAWPAILEQVLQVMVNYVDSAMVGSLGASETAAISVNSSTIWLVNGLMNALAIGFSVLMARHLGSGNRGMAKNVVRQAIACESMFGLGTTVIMLVVSKFLPSWLHADPTIREKATSYMWWISAGYLPTMLMIGLSALLRLSGDTRTPLYLNALNNLCNIILNLFFIFPRFRFLGITVSGFGLGVKGAAMATSIAATITAVSLLVTLKQPQRNIQLEKGSWKTDSAIQKTALILSLPIALERSTLSFGQIALTAMITRLGITALAAHYLANTAEQITFLPPSGFATAATTLVAQSLGSGNEKLAKHYADTCTLWGFILMTCMGALMFLFAPQLIGIFTADTAVILLGSAVLRIEAFGEPGFGLSQLVFGVLRGAGDTKIPFFISLLGMWMVRIPFAWILLKTTALGLKGIWIAMMTDLTIRGIVSWVYYRKGRWKHIWKTHS